MTHLNDLLNSKIVAVLRGHDTDRVLEITAALLDGGLHAIEITMDSPTPGQTLDAVSSAFDEALVGAGTVHSSADVDAAVDAGATFLFSPVLDESIVQAGRERSVITVPGCMTPSEIMRGRDAGAHAVKLFPAAELGPSYLRSIQGPLADVPVIPTGGIGPDNLRSFIEAGGAAAGVGSYLTGTSGSSPPEKSTITARAESLLKAFPDPDDSRINDH